MECICLLLLAAVEARRQAPSVVAAWMVLCAFVRVQRLRRCGLELVFAKHLEIGSFRQSGLPIDRWPILRNVFELSFHFRRSVYHVRSGDRMLLHSVANAT